VRNNLVSGAESRKRQTHKEAAESERLKSSKIEHFSGGDVCSTPQDGIFS